MKAKISIMLLALVAVAFLAVAPAAADTTYVPAAGVVFVGEEGLTLDKGAAGTSVTPVLANDKLVWFAPGDSISGAPSATYIAQGGSNEVIDPSMFQTRTGNWYDAASIGLTDTVVMNVQMPSIDVKVFDATTGKDMTNQRVIKGTKLAFRLDSNLYQVINQRTATLPVGSQSTDVKVVVVDSEGTTYTGLVDNASATPVSTSRLTGPEAVAGTLYGGLTPNSSQYYLPGNSTPVGALTFSNWDLDSNQYKAGVYTFYAEVNLNGAKDNVGTVTGVTKSAVKTLEVGKDDVKIEANKDTVVRNSDFAVTITGRPNTPYALWVKDTASITPSVPFIKANQSGVDLGAAGLYIYTGVSTGPTVASDVPAAAAPQGGAYQALVTLSDSGTRTVGFGTDTTTKDQTYTIRADLYVPPVVPFVVYSPTYDTVKVKVEKGGVTVTASGDSSYYIGEEIVISGTNTDSDDTYLFITGPNLETNGAPITEPEKGVVTGGEIYDPVTKNTTTTKAWKPESVDTDDTWEFKWSTAGVNLDAGTYTIYAVTTSDAKNALNDAIYSTASIVIKKPFVTATTSSQTVAKGDDLYITGTAEGDPSSLAVWILGKNKVVYDSSDVEDDGSFEFDTSTDSYAAGQYFVVVQHPMENGILDLVPNAGLTQVRNVVTATKEFDITGRQGSEIASALVNAMNSHNIDDTYFKLTFMVEEPWIVINAIGDKYVGDSFLITGTTNLAAGDQLIVEAQSASFKPTDKTQASGFVGATGTVTVTPGDKEGENVWEFNVDTASFIPDQYIVTVEAIEASLTGTQTFNVMKAVPTTKPTEPVETPVATVTPVKTAEPTPEQTAPGFGVLVALIGLGAVAALIVRRD